TAPSGARMGTPTPLPCTARARAIQSAHHPSCATSLRGSIGSSHTTDATVTLWGTAYACAPAPAATPAAPPLPPPPPPGGTLRGPGAPSPTYTARFAGHHTTGWPAARQSPAPTQTHAWPAQSVAGGLRPGRESAPPPLPLR